VIIKNNTSNSFFPLDKAPNKAANNTIKTLPKIRAIPLLKTSDKQRRITKGDANNSIKTRPENTLENNNLPIGL
jgi:hypothetical protein